MNCWRRIRGACLIVGFLTLWAPLAPAQDALDVIKVTGSTTQYRGKITAMSSTDVTIQSGTIGVKTIPANEIEFIFFGDADELKAVRGELNRGNYEAADRRLKKLDKEKLDGDNAKAEFDYLQGVVAARLAQGGQGTLLDAAKLLLAYVKAHPNNYNYYPANELLGDLLVGLGKFPQAETYYTELTKAPWPEYKMRASIASGRAQLAQNKFTEAYKNFDAALSLAQLGAKGTEAQVLSATLGKAEALALGGKVAEGLKIAEEVLAKANPDESDLYARIYNTLGFCYQKASRDKDALLAYLHVDLLYATQPDTHAEALANLATLWEKLGRPDRATQARTTLQTKYPGSRWIAKKG